MATAFTTWAALVTAIKNDIRSGSWLTKSYTTPAGVTVTYNDLKDIREFLEWAMSQEAAASEAGGFISYPTFEDAS